MNALVPVRPAMSSQEQAHHILKLNEQFMCAMITGRIADAKRIEKLLRSLGA